VFFKEFKDVNDTDIMDFSALRTQGDQQVMEFLQNIGKKIPKQSSKNPIQSSRSPIPSSSGTGEIQLPESTH
jgi:hypothetical protein